MTGMDATPCEEQTTAAVHAGTSCLGESARGANSNIASEFGRREERRSTVHKRISFNFRRLKIVWILWTGNMSASSRAYWGWVSMRTAIEASSGWGLWFRVRDSVSG